MKFAWSEPRQGGTKTVHFIFSERETKILFDIVGDLKPSVVAASMDEDLEVSEEDISKFLSSLFEALQKCQQSKDTKP
jgi:hypothetical protein